MGKAHRTIRRLAGIGILLLAGLPLAAQAERIKDIADVVGVRDNQLMGYGLVVGLDGTGDSPQTSSPFTLKSMVSMLERMGINLRQEVDSMRPDNVAAVMVTATLPPYTSQGQKINVSVSSLGDAESLQGGVLVMTPLKGPDGQVYAVAQGPVSLGGFGAQGEGGEVQVNHLTSGSIPNGALVERELPISMNGKKTLRLALRQTDFTTATRVARSVDKELGGDYAQATDPGTVRVEVPSNYQDRVVPLVSRLENLSVRTARKARVVLDERTGTVIIGKNVRVHPVAVSHGNLNITITEKPQVSQPASFGAGVTTVVPRTEIEAGEEKADLILLQPGVDLSSLVGALNSIGASTRDLIAILRAIKEAGALTAELKII
ncbi:flagellar basal body P-ring protein FlgI [Thiohalorhabdus methylotrophus]|uniref:Flagellar P-ring protein n=1 Tax=Thiohalorhabdus methylotrophus TaxID=3242694 RepID=A0ABV4TY39_9GAMM